MKVLAYTSQDGDVTITPLSAKSKGIGTLYSRHPAGQRIEMYVNRRGSNHFFAYKGDHSPSDVNEPESLTHTICKTVLKELANQNIQTQLHLTHRTQRLQPFTIALQAGRDEFGIDTSQTRYFIDVFCEFEQTEEPYLLSYECKWNGQIAFEFCHANGLSASDRKCKDLEHLGIPIIQSDLPILFAGATISNGNVRGIVLNLQGYNESPWIRRVTLSHELGHLLWDPAEKLNSLRVDTFDAIEHSAEELGDPVEARANAFAAEFLAPRAAVSEFIQDCSSDEVAIQAVCEHFGVGPGTARLQIQNASNEKRFVDHLRFKISPNERWYSIENFTADYLPGAENVPVNRRGKFSYWVAKSAIDNLISFDTAGLYLGVDFPLDSEKAKSIASLFTAQTI